MVIIFLRTVIIYLLLSAALRIMGKRQIGELEVSELITTLMLSELATGPIGSRDTPIAYAVIPIITLMTLEITNSIILLKLPALRHLVAPTPNILIRRGRIDRPEMARIRLSVEELISELRQQGITSVEEVDYAILERNGKMTVLPLSAKGKSSGFSHLLIADGHVSRHQLAASGHDRAWLELELKKRGCTRREVFLMTVNDSGHILLIKREDTAP